MKDERIYTNKAPKPVGLYPHARRAGDLIFLSGIGPRDAMSGEIPGNKYDGKGNLFQYDFELQCHSVFKNVNAVLEAAGARWENLLDVTIYLTDMKKDFDTMNSLYALYFKDSQPCRTTVEVKSMPTPIAIELKCIAMIE